MLILFLILALTKTVKGLPSVSADGCKGSTNPSICDPLPNGNGEVFAASRAGSLGGVVDDFFQDYNGDKPASSISKAQVIAKYGPIETWDTSQVTTMQRVFWQKMNINPDIRKWNVESVENMIEMFYYANSFNRDLSSWIVSSVTEMMAMFHQATAYNQVLCGNTWIESTATKTGMFDKAGPDAKIGSEVCTVGAFDLEDYATTFRATRDAYLKAANELKLATGPYEAARDAYVAATATYTKSLYERRHLRAEPSATSAMLEAPYSDHKDLVLKSVDAKHLKVLQDAYWKADSSESKFHTAQSIEQFLTTQLD